MTPAATLKAVRLIHNYIGIFFAPTILFFAITGALQMFGLHQAIAGNSYVPPPLLAHLAQLHKKGTLYLPPRKAPGANVSRPAAAKADKEKASGGDSSPAPTPHTLPIKIYFAATSLALVLSTCTGLFLAWKFARQKLTPGLVLLAGIACPLFLLLF